ncbi:MAG TPA: glycosyltransferase family 4 protein [Candidatus Sulfomarinibacteraceae bacterium]|nr:glycosyltransferase family 4 protein [Candidatus Sulfomarinibacteraceae bacterium]
MKVAIFLSSLGRARGGLETIAAGFARQLAAAGHEVTCVAGRGGAPLPADLQALPVRWLRLPAVASRGEGLALQSLSFSAACFLSPAVRRLLARSDVTLSLLEIETVLLSRWRARGGPGAGRPHLSYFPGGIDWRWLRRDRSTVRVATSHTVAQTYAGQHGLRIDGVVTPGVDAALGRQPYTVRPQATKLLFTGRLERNKGVLELLYIFRALAREQPELTLTMLGHGPLRRRLRAQAEDAGLAARLFLPGAVAPHRVRRALGAADLFLFPTHYESFGVAVVEAQMAGLPVVCSDLPAMAEVAAPAARLLPPRQPQQWIEAVAPLLADAESRRRMSEQGRQQARRFTWDRVGQSLQRYLRLALHRGATGAK